jgi:hypothetical protein
LSFEVNSETHTGARPSVRLCVGPELTRCVHSKLRALHRGTFLGPFACGARACSLCSYIGPDNQHHRHYLPWNMGTFWVVYSSDERLVCPRRARPRKQSCFNFAAVHLLTCTPHCSFQNSRTSLPLKAFVSRG